MARSIRDIAATLDAVSGRHPGDAYSAPCPTRPFAEEVGSEPGRLRIGVLSHDPAGDFTVHDDVVSTTRAAADVLARLGHDVSDQYPAALTDRSFLEDFMKCTTVVQLREIERYGDLIGRPLGEQDMEWQTWQYVLEGAEVAGREYAAGVDALRAYAGALERWWEDDGWDILLTPTAGCKQAGIGELKTKKGDPFSDAIPMLGFTVPYNVSGQPAFASCGHRSGRVADRGPTGRRLWARGRTAQSGGSTRARDALGSEKAIVGGGRLCLNAIATPAVWGPLSPPRSVQVV